MKLRKKSIYGLLIVIAGLVLTTGHTQYRDGSDLHPLRAFEIGGSYLIVYALFAGALVGLIVRLLSGQLFSSGSRK